MKIHLNNKKFKSIANSGNGEVSEDTLFHYRQNGENISATYQGGKILRGELKGRQFPDNHLEFTYRHVNTDNETMTGQCKSYPNWDINGKIVIKEFWQWTCKDNGKGQSTIMEI